MSLLLFLFLCRLLNAQSHFNMVLACLFVVLLLFAVVCCFVCCCFVGCLFVVLFVCLYADLFVVVCYCLFVHCWLLFVLLVACGSILAVSGTSWNIGSHRQTTVWTTNMFFHIQRD